MATASIFGWMKFGSQGNQFVEINTLAQQQLSLITANDEPAKRDIGFIEDDRMRQLRKRLA
jgi:hypothetical protein